MGEKETLYIRLAAYFSSQCSLSEKEEVNNWRNENPDHEALFLKLKKQWEEAGPNTSSFVVPDKAVVWERIQTQIKSKQIQLYSRSLLIRVVSIAAVIALVIGFSLSRIIRQSNPVRKDLQQMIIMAPLGQKSQLLLPDGTQVFLNSGSQLTYSSGYNTEERIVTLEGEAFFDVTKNTEHPFIVKTGLVDVKVYGTAFNVSAYSDENNISVSLLRGSVSVLSSVDNHLLTLLEPNQSVVIEKESMKYDVQACNAEADGVWHLNKLKFEGTPTAEVWKKLERWYGVQITLSNECPTNAYWFTVKTESLTELLKMINRITPIEYQLNGEEVTIQYK